ncbi:MAG: tetratricopeptide repeat protein [Caldilineaceae bacterium]
MLNKPGHEVDVSTSHKTGLQIYLLGQLRIERNGEPLQLPRRKVEALLAYLLLHPERHSRDALATLFWGDTSDVKARHSLRTGLATLRQYLGEALLLSDRDHVQLNPDFPLWVDLHILLSVAKQPDTMDLTNPESVNSLLALWHTELLTDLYEDWIETEREHYQARLQKLFLNLTQILRAQSEYKRAIEVANHLLKFDPANEAAHQHLMFCYVASGDRGAALRQYELCERALLEDLDAPPLQETTALYQWIKQQEEDSSSTAARITNLPIPLTSFVGRTQQLTEVKRLLSPTACKTRLLTLTGAGGSGKTRLAIQSATDLIDSFAHGVWWVELSALTEAEQVARAVAKALGVNEVAHEACLQTVSHSLVDKQLLLVLDNCEHLIEASAEVATYLLGACPNLQILTTSRESLNVAGEVVWQVPTLALPEAQQISLLDILLQYECIRLFYERASAVQPGFRLTLENATAVIQICTHLDGIPLAIELAAARVKVLPVEQIATRLSSAIGARFTLLTQGSRNVQPRQQTLRAAIDWSYATLDEKERQLFRILAIFRGGFTLEALEAIVGSQGDTPQSAMPNLLDLLTQLVDKSLVIVEPHGGENRYRLLETLREYALEQFVHAAEEQRLQQCHAEVFLALAEKAEPDLIRVRHQGWLDRVETELPNLRAALEFLLVSEQGELALRLASLLYRFCDYRSYVQEGREWLQKALTKRATATTATIAKALNASGWLAFRQGDLEDAHRYLQEGLALFQTVEDEYGIADILQMMAVIEMDRGEYVLGRQHLEESLRLSQQLNDLPGIARAMARLGGLAWDQDRFAESRDYHRENLRLQREIGHQVHVAVAALNVGDTERMLDNFTAARTYYEESLQIAQTLQHKGVTGAALKGLGLLSFRQGDYQQARQFSEEALHIFQEVGDKSHIGFAYSSVGDVHCKFGENNDALNCYSHYLQIMVEIGYKWPTFDALESISILLTDLGKHLDTATRFWGAADQLRQETGLAVAADQHAKHERILNCLRQQLGDGPFQECFKAGHTTPLTQLVAEAMALTL